MDYDTTADEIIAKIPPLPELHSSSGLYGITYWEPPKGSFIQTSFSQTYQEPWDLFLERCQCYWDRGCSAKMARELKLPKDEERSLIRACWLKLKLPSQLPGFPEHWYADAPRPEYRGSFDVGKHQI